MDYVMTYTELADAIARVWCKNRVVSLITECHAEEMVARWRNGSVPKNMRRRVARMVEKRVNDEWDRRQREAA